MRDSFTSQVSRRQALKLGAGIAAAAAGTGAVGSLAVAAMASNNEASETLIDGVGTVDSVDGHLIRAHLADGRTIVAELRGFPATVTPRVGDLVAVDMEVNKPLCAENDSENSPTATQPGVAAAFPLCHWTDGTPSVNGATARLGSQRLVASPAVLVAARRSAKVSVCTLDTTLPVHLVLAIRPLAFE